MIRTQQRWRRLWIQLCLFHWILAAFGWAPGSSISCGWCEALVTPSPENANAPGIRLNKVFKTTHSRRQADALIAAGRVSVNGVPADPRNNMGMRVLPYQDTVELDGQRIVGWEEQLPELVLAVPSILSEHTTSTANSTTMNEEYIKYWKPVGITSTTDRNVPGNLLDELMNPTTRSPQQQQQQPPITQRIFSVGRLDKDSSGLLLLTSDGRVPNAVLRKQFKRPKTYHVVVDRPVSDAHIATMRQGLVITTDTVRQGKHRSLTAKTLPCGVERISTSSIMVGNNSVNGDHRNRKAYTRHDGNDDDSNSRGLQITLTEGRNRQIRVMLRTLGYEVRSLHRVGFMGIGLQGLNRPGDWMRLTLEERQILWNAVAAAASSTLERENDPVK